MGQIIGRSAKPDACNLRSLSSFGTPGAGQHILVSTDNSAMQNGQGNFDAYVVGDGRTAVDALPLHVIDESQELSTSEIEIPMETTGSYHKAYFPEIIPAGTVFKRITWNSGTLNSFYFVKADDNMDTSALIKASNFPLTRDYDVKGIAALNAGTMSFFFDSVQVVSKFTAINTELSDHEGRISDLEDDVATLPQIQQDVADANELVADSDHTKNSDLLRVSLNLFDGTFTQGGYWNNGSYIATPIYSHNTNPIPVSVGMKLQSTYKESGGDRNYLDCYIQEFSDEEGTQPITRSAAITSNVYNCTDSNVKSVILCFRTDLLHIDIATMEWMVYDLNNEYLNIYKPHNTSSWPIYLPYGYAINELDAEKRKTLTGLYGKKVVCFGDSITEFGFYPLYAQMLAGGTFYNCGIGGTWLTHRTDDYGAFSAEAIAAAVSSGDWSAQTTAAQTLTQYAAIVERMSTIDYSSVDIITFAFGTNDWGNTGHLEGAESIDNFDTNTYRGAINYICKMIQSVYPQIKIVFICPIFRVSVGANINEYHESTYETTGYTDSDTTQNQIGKTLKEICAIIESQASKNHCDVLNMYDDFGSNRYNYLEWLYDGVHLTFDGYREYGRRLAGFLLANP